MGFNLIDLAIIGVIAVFALIGWYRGFLSSLIHSLSVFGAFFVTKIGYRQLASWLVNKWDALNFALQFTDAGEKMSDIELARTVVSTAGDGAVSRALEICRYPNFINRLIEKNINNLAFSDIGLATMEQYFNQTLAIAVIHVVCYVALFVAAFIVLELLISMLMALWHPPILRQFDSLAGSAVGLLSGLLIVRVLFMLVPTALALMGIEQIEAWFTEAAIASKFFKSSFLLRGIKGTLIR